MTMTFIDGEQDIAFNVERSSTKTRNIVLWAGLLILGVDGLVAAVCVRRRRKDRDDWYD